MLVMETMTEWLTGLTSDVRGVAIGVIALVVLVFMAYRVVKSGFSLASIVTTALAGGLVLWLTIGNGMQTIADLLKNQA